MRTRVRISILVASVLALAATIAGRAFPQTTPEGHTIAVNGIEMYYEVVGEGDPLVLLHGGLQSGRSYDPFVEEFSKHYRLIIPDLRGHGRSTNPGGKFAMPQFPGDVFALLDHLGIDRFKAVGTSLGALTLLYMATQQPDRVEAMILVGSGTYLPETCRQQLREWTADTYPETGWNYLRGLHLNGDEQIRSLFDLLAMLAEDCEDVAFTPPYLSRIKATTLIVHGDRDYCFPASMAVEIYNSIPRSYLWIVPNGPHVPIYGPRASAFAETALEFFGGSWERG